MGEGRNSTGFFLKIVLQLVICLKNNFALCNFSGQNLFIMQCIVLHPKVVLQRKSLYRKERYGLWQALCITVLYTFGIFQKNVEEMKYLFSACFASSQIKYFWLTFMFNKTWCIFLFFSAGCQFFATWTFECSFRFFRFFRIKPNIPVNWRSSSCFSLEWLSVVKEKTSVKPIVGHQKNIFLHT